MARSRRPDRGDLQAAVQGFESAVAGGRAAFDVYFYLGSAYLKLGQAERSVTRLREAVARNPAYTPSSLELASAYLQVERPDAAIAVLREALARDPRSFELHTQPRLHRPPAPRPRGREAGGTRRPGVSTSATSTSA